MNRSEYRRADRECTEEYIVYDTRTLERIGSMYYLSLPPDVHHFAIIYIRSSQNWWIYTHEYAGFGLCGTFGLPAGEVIEAIIYGQE